MLKGFYLCIIGNIFKVELSYFRKFFNYLFKEMKLLDEKIVLLFFCFMVKGRIFLDLDYIKLSLNNDLNFS